jgi:hypothetical protein
VLGKARQVHWLMYLTAGVFVVYFGMAALQSWFG